MKTWTVDVHTDPMTDEAYIELPEEVMQQANLNPGDNIVWKNNNDGSVTLTKQQDNVLVLVDTISQYRMRYLVEVPADHPEWALDTVTAEEAREFSQLYLGETITSHRVISKQEAIDICNIDNPYLTSWADEQKLSTFITPLNNDHEEA